MDDLANCCFHISRLQGMSYVRAIISHHETVLILRGVASSSQTYVASKIIWVPPDGVL